MYKQQVSSFFLIFIWLFPFSYALQVIFNNPVFGALPAILLILCIIFLRETYEDFFCIKNQKRSTKFLIFIYWYYFLNNFFLSIIYLNVNFSASLRALLLYAAPFLILQHLNKKDVNYIYLVLKIISITGVIVGAELIYEDYVIYFLKEEHGSLFQQLNYHYVLDRSNTVLTRLYSPEYRPTGLLEHVHATVLFLITSSFSSLALYLRNNKLIYFLAFSLCSFLLLLHGVRSMTILFLFSLLIFFSLFYLTKLKISNDKFYFIFGSYFVVLVFIIFIDPMNTISKYYKDALFHGYFNIPYNLSVFDIYLYELNNFFSTDVGGLMTGKIFSWKAILHLLVGKGPTYFLLGKEGSSDDAYFLELFLHYGLVGLLLIITFIVKSCNMILKNEIKNSDYSILLILSFSLFLIIILSSIHSPALAHKAIFIVFVLFFGILIKLLGINKNS